MSTCIIWLLYGVALKTGKENRKRRNRKFLKSSLFRLLVYRVLTFMKVSCSVTSTLDQLSLNDVSSEYLISACLLMLIHCHKYHEAYILGSEQ